MPVTLLGLMAIALFYLITVVIGLCANRCLKREDESSDDLRDEGGGGAPTMTPLDDEIVPVQRLPKFASADHTHHQHIRRDPSAEVELVELLDAPGPSNRILQPINENVIANHASSSMIMRARFAETRQARMLTSLDTTEETQSSSAANRSKLPPAGMFLLAERNVGVVFGSLSVLAIKTGGIFSSSISEQVFSQGLLWCHVPLASSLSLIIGGILFSRQLYSEGYVTILDPFQEVYGRRVGVLMSVPMVFAEILFAACVLSSLATLMELVLGISSLLWSLSSLFAVICYLTAGGLYAGIFTNAVQFIYLCLGLWTFFPFTLFRATESIESTFPSWLGKVDGKQAGLFIDQLVMLVLGGIPMQSYFQRILAARASRGPRVMAIVGSFGCILNAIPAIMIGVAAASTDWNSTSYGAKLEMGNASNVLHLSLAHLVPSGVAFICIGALASGLIASCDSAILGASTIIAHNLFRSWLRPNASEREIVWICRFSIMAISLLILGMCLVIPGLHSNWQLPYDILYVLVFPQLFCVVYFKYANTYGAFAGLVVGTAVRLLFGVAKLRIPAILQLPFFDFYESNAENSDPALQQSGGQLFPYRTLAMLISLITTIFVSTLCHWLTYRGVLSSSQDVFGCFTPAQQSPAHENRTSELVNQLETVERMTVV